MTLHFEDIQDKSDERKNADEVSKRMGELLLKGVAMLGEYCICGVNSHFTISASERSFQGILMQERGGRKLCIECKIKEEKNPKATAVEKNLDPAVEMKIAVQTPMQVCRSLSSLHILFLTVFYSWGRPDSPSCSGTKDCLVGREVGEDRASGRDHRDSLSYEQCSPVAQVI